MVGVTIKGVKRTQFAMSRFGDKTNQASLRVVRKSAKEIRDLARLYAPVDEGDLEESIRIIKEVRGDKRRLVQYIGVDPAYLGVGYQRYRFRYDVEMHDGEYNLGPLSRIKDSVVGRGKVGRLYLKRAVDELSPEITEKIKEKMAGFLR